MAIRYITHVRKAEGAKHVSEITDYRYFKSDDKEKTYTATKKDFCEKYYSDGTVFSYSPKSETAECEMKESSNGEKYLQTKGNGTTSDNLFNLPTF